MWDFIVFLFLLFRITKKDIEMLSETNRIKYAGTGYEDEVEPDKKDHMIIKYKYLAFKML